MSRRLRSVPRPKLEIDRSTNTDVEIRKMTDDERKRQAAIKPKDKDFMTWKPIERKEVGD